MNDKFFDLKKNKQDMMINASLKVFAQNGYYRASTDVIVKEAGISKGLLFHYFGSKKNLYIFILEYSARYMIMELSQGINRSENKLFTLFQLMEKNKTKMLKNYPYLELFLTGCASERHEDVREEADKWTQSIREAYQQIYGQADVALLRDGLDLEKVTDMIALCMEGYKNRKYRDDRMSPDQILSGFIEYLQIFEECMANKTEDVSQE